MAAIRDGVDAYTQPCFSLSNRFARLTWGITYMLFFRPSPRTFHGWRVFLLRLFGAKIGRKCRIYPKARIWGPWNLVVGDYSSMGDDVNCYNMATITLGEKTIVSQGTHLCAGTHDYEDPMFRLYSEPITVGDRAWLCTECYVGPGVKVGEGAVVGARSVVVKDVPAWTVCAGNPCKPIKKRLMKKTDEQRE